MNSILTQQQYYDMNYAVDQKSQQDAIKELKKLGVSVKEHPITIYIVNGEYLSPATMIERLKKGHYAKTESGNAVESVAAVIPSHKGRPSRRVQPAQRVHRDSDKRVGEREGTRSYGRGSGKAVRGRDTRLKEVARAEAKIVRKSRSDISSVESDNRTSQTRVERERESRTDKPKSSGTGQRNSVRQETLRGKNTSRIRTPARLRKRRT